MTVIEPLRPEDWSAAMLLAFARVPEAERGERAQQCVNLLAAGRLDPRGVWVARRAGKPVGVQVCVPLAGSTCLFWLPTAPNGVAARLVQAGLDHCRSLGCKVAQALAHADEIAHTGPLLRCGFRPTTRMHLLEHDLRNLIDEPTAPLRFEAFRPSLQAAFAATLQRTYEGTLDCPELNGARTMDEILAGHRGQGRFHPDFWWLAYEGAEPVGVLMLAELPDGLTWEVAYLGMVPECRRRRLGRAMMLHALDALRAQPVARLTLAVDTRNEPALRLYRSLGFVETKSNEVLLYFFR
ncbi:MAG: GNAT family N-acetyltransferase [Gemmataceae bacterium]|nr:GNAT family N-acetyltransferase [Gemmataceae bacterium]